MRSAEPGYLRTGILEIRRRAEEAVARLRECRGCAQECGANRLADAEGTCRTGRHARVASAFPHFGEEAPLAGRGGSGTIFFAGCNLRCVFCQNSDISQGSLDPPCPPEILAVAMLRLQEAGCHNINLVSPSHVVPQILEALVIAAGRGLRLPLVYNTGTYDSLGTLRLLDGIVDIYMPDTKYSSDEAGKTFSGAPRYGEVMRAALREMHRQVGDLELDPEGIAVRGLLVRHLVLPNRIAGSRSVLEFLAREIGTGTYLNIMAQYRPLHRAHEHAELSRRPTPAELSEVIGMAIELGLRRLDGIRRPA